MGRSQPILTSPFSRLWALGTNRPLAESLFPTPASPLPPRASLRGSGASPRPACLVEEYALCYLRRPIKHNGITALRLGGSWRGGAVPCMSKHNLFLFSDWEGRGGLTLWEGL